MSISALGTGLSSYPGTVIFVAHDRDLIDTVATRILAFHHGGLEDFAGDYENVFWRGTAASSTRTEQVSAPPDQGRDGKGRHSRYNDGHARSGADRHHRSGTDRRLAGAWRCGGRGPTPGSSASTWTRGRGSRRSKSARPMPP